MEKMTLYIGLIHLDPLQSINLNLSDDGSLLIDARKWDQCLSQPLDVQVALRVDRGVAKELLLHALESQIKVIAFNSL